jgi:hypothetical protein
MELLRNHQKTAKKGVSVGPTPLFMINKKQQNQSGLDSLLPFDLIAQPGQP